MDISPSELSFIQEHFYQSQLQQALSGAAQNGQTSITDQKLSLNFNGTGGDAATSFGKIDIYISASQGKDGSWQVSGKGSDRYDFAYQNYNKPAFTTANNTAYYGQKQGTVTNFTTYLNFSQSIPASQTFTTPSSAVVRWDGGLVSGPPQKK